MTEAPKRLLLSLADAAEVLSMKRTSMYELISRGDVVSVKIGKRRLVTAESLEAYVERLTAGEG